MNIWSLGADDNSYQGITPVNRVDERYFDSEQGEHWRKFWTPVPIKFYDWEAEDENRESNKLIPDITLFLLDHLICNKPSFDLLSVLIGDSVEVFPLNNNSEELFLIEVSTRLDCFDSIKSEYETSSGGDFYHISKFVLKEECVGDQYIFKLPHISRIFVSDRFKDVVERAGLRGLTFRLI